VFVHGQEQNGLAAYSRVRSDRQLAAKVGHTFADTEQTESPAIITASPTFAVIQTS
jgi:hypothetical protein